MKLFKIKSKVLSKALETPKEYFCLTCYTDFFKRTEDGCFISGPNHCCGTNLRASIEDFCFNEGASGEPQKLFALGKELLGTATIDLTIVNEVEI